MYHIKRERKGQLWEREALYFHRGAFPGNNDHFENEDEALDDGDNIPSQRIFWDVFLRKKNL